MYKLILLLIDSSLLLAFSAGYLYHRGAQLPATGDKDSHRFVR